jgi:hypothetical protein
VTADECSALDPRSLAPDRSFWSAFDELIWGRTSPADFCNCYDERALDPSSHDPRRDERRDALPVLTSHALFLAEAVTRGEPHILHSFRPRCRFFLALTSFSRPRYRLERATSAGLPRRSCSGDRGCTGQRTERRTGRQPITRRYCFSCSVHALRRVHADQRSLPRQSSGHPLSSVRQPVGEEPHYRRDGPTEARVPAASREGRSLSAKPGCLPPPASTRPSAWIAPRRLPASVPRSRRPHVLPSLGKGAFYGHCKHHGAVTRDPWRSERRAPFRPAGQTVPGTDDPSTPAWLGRCGRSRG